MVDEISSMKQKAISMQLDVADIKSFDTFIAKLSLKLKTNWDTNTFDYLINNAGIGATPPFQQLTEKVFDHLLSVHFKGVYFLTKKFLPLLNGNGGVIFISTETIRFCVPGYSVYVSIKGVVEIFTLYYAKECGPRGIRANSVATGAIENDFYGATIRNNPQMKAFIASQTALERVGQADGVENFVAFQ